MQTIAIGNDHGGLDLKPHVLKYLEEKGYGILNCGSDAGEIVRYPRHACEVVAAVLAGHVQRGILICSTGIGMSIFANKYKGIRASLCTSSYLAKMTRAHNDSNVLCLGGRVTGWLEALDILETWLLTPYEGGRHDISLGLIAEAEAAMHNGSVWRPAGPEKK
jgi:ribose 5-phosphate isomerase B